MDERRGRVISLVVPIILALAAIVSAIAGYGRFLPPDSAWVPVLRVLGATFVVLTILAAVSAFVGHSGVIAFCGRIFAKRDDADWRRLRKSIEELADTPAAITAIMPYLSKDDPAPVFVDALLRAVLANAQWALANFCEDAVCSLKHVIADKSGTEYVKCVYPPHLPARYRALTERVKAVPRGESFVDEVLRDRDFVIVPRLWDESVKRPFGDSYANRLRNTGVKGVALTRVYLFDSTADTRRPIAAFKVFLFREDGLIDNEPARLFLKYYGEMCSLVIQSTLSLFGVSYEEIVSASGVLEDEQCD